MRGGYQQSCGRDGAGSHLPLPSTDLLPFWREQVMKGSQVLHPYQDPELLLTRRIRAALEKNPGLSLLAPLPRQVTLESYLKLI